MNDIKAFHKSWSQKHKELRRLLSDKDQHERAIELFLSQHAVLHSAKMSQTDSWSYEDEILDDMSEELMRRIPRNCEHSVAWAIWHIARIEDVTMNMLIAGTRQLFDQDDWYERLQVAARDTGNEMAEVEMAEVSTAVAIDALRDYRVAVGRRTRKIARQLQPDELKQKVDPDRLQRLLADRVVVAEASGLIDYWGNRTTAGMLLMPPTRHCMVHLNEAYRLKQRRQ